MALNGRIAFENCDDLVYTSGNKFFSRNGHFCRMQLIESKLIFQLTTACRILEPFRYIHRRFLCGLLQHGITESSVVIVNDFLSNC